MSDDTAQESRFSRSRSTGAAVYNDYKDNVVIWPGREDALAKFVKQTYGGRSLKLLPTKSSNSEDALTWSCFDALSQIRGVPGANALTDLWALAFDNRLAPPKGFLTGNILIGKKYGGEQEETEVDASIEGDQVLVFIEAKLYSPMSQADPPTKPHDQIARKLRVG